MTSPLSPSKKRVMFPTQVAEMDLLLGGGLREETAVSLRGAAGSGGTQLLTLLAASIATPKRPVFYISSEHTLQHMAMRIRAFGHKKSPVSLCSSSKVEDLWGAVNEAPDHSVIILDRIDDFGPPILFNKIRHQIKSTQTVIARTSKQLVEHYSDVALYIADGIEKISVTCLKNRHRDYGRNGNSVTIAREKLYPTLQSC